MKLPIFKGTRYEIGVLMGRAFASTVKAECEDVLQNPPPAKNVSRFLQTAHELTARTFPKVLTELKGVAVGAGVSYQTLFLAMTEELWDAEDQETGCTDIAATGKATTNRRLLVGHNNDEEPDNSPPSLIRLRPDDGPVVTAVSLGGTGLSVGVNSFGLMLAGNQLTATDVKPGIPRLLLVRAALEMSTIEKAVEVLTHPQRASSYNNILADADGRVVSIEGSGEKAALIGPTPDGILSHSNHYLHEDMVDIEGKADFRSSRIREQRSCKMLSGSAGSHTLKTFAEILRDHQGYPVSICRHGSDAVTGFSVIFEPEVRRLWFLEGRPCKKKYLPVNY